MAIAALLIGALLLAAGSASLLTSDSSAPEKWSIVCDGNGAYSFIDFTGSVARKSFPTHEAAVEAAKAAKKWSDDYDAERSAEASAKRNALFKPCK